MSPDEVLEKHSSYRLQQWQAFFAVRNEQLEKEQKQTQQAAQQQTGQSQQAKGNPSEEIAKMRQKQGVE